MELKLNLVLPLLLVGLCGYSWAYPNPLQLDEELGQPLNTLYIDEPLQLLLPVDQDQEEEQLSHRLRRQLNVQGGGSPRQGFDLSVNGRAPVWQSPNGRHSLDATGQYSQHLGGPWGNSRPSWGAGGVYTFRF